MVFVLREFGDSAGEMSLFTLLRRVTSDSKGASGLKRGQRMRWRRRRRACYLELLERMAAEGAEMLRLADADRVDTLEQLLRRRAQLYLAMARLRIFGELHFAGLADFQAPILRAHRGFQAVISSSILSRASIA
jgi:hypothetical protein